MILLIDNYDSFAHNLARYFRQLGQPVTVVRNDEISVGEIAELVPAAIVISPGPRTPNDAGICLDMVAEFAATIPILGVCLGHQIICQSFGGVIRRVSPIHGRASVLTHFGHEVFDGIGTPFSAGRYHSLVVQPKTASQQLEVIAVSADGVVMAVAHREFPVIGVQFHPESILTTCGYQLLSNFLRLANLPVDACLIAQLTNDLVAQTARNPLRNTNRHPTVTPHAFSATPDRDSNPKPEKNTEHSA